MRALHARRCADGWRPGSAAGLRSRTYAELVRARARNHHALRSDHAHSDARLSIHRTENPVVLAAGHARRRARSSRTGAAGAGGGGESLDRVLPERGPSAFDAYAVPRSSPRVWFTTQPAPA